jgi:hypothetical protein
MRLQFLTLLCTTTGLACGFADAQDGAPYSANHQTYPKIYLLDDSRGHEVTITGDGVPLWKGIVQPSRESPNVHVAGAPLIWQQKCKVVVTGGPYSAAAEIDWRKGSVLVIHFFEDVVSLSQRTEPVGFQ